MPAAIACHTPTPSAPPPPPPPVAEATFEVTSPAFLDGAEIDTKYTCDGDNLAPPIWWAYVPTKTASIAVIARDDGALAQIVAGIAADATFVLPMCSKTVGPACAPSTGAIATCSRSALDAMIGWHGITLAELEHAIAGHVLARGSIAGTYARKL